MKPGIKPAFATKFTQKREVGGEGGGGRQLHLNTNKKQTILNIRENFNHKI